MITNDPFVDWLLRSGVALVGADEGESGDVDADDAEVDEDEDESDGVSDGDSDGEDDDDSDSNDSDRDLESELRKAKRELRKTKRDLDEALDMLEENENSSGRGSNDDEDDSEVASLREENDQMRKLLNGAYIEQQISNFRDKEGNPRWDWEDPETVFALLDRSDLEVDVETGEIDGLEEQLEDLAKKKPFLLKDKSRSRSGSKGGSSGKPPGKSGAGKPKPTSRETLASDFSILNSF